MLAAASDAASGAAGRRRAVRCVGHQTLLALAMTLGLVPDAALAE